MKMLTQKNYRKQKLDKTRKPPGYGGINVEFKKYAGPTVHYRFLIPLNGPICQKLFLHIWGVEHSNFSKKNFKKGDKAIFNNYRKIRSLSSAYKFVKNITRNTIIKNNKSNDIRAKSVLLNKFEVYIPSDRWLLIYFVRWL